MREEIKDKKERCQRKNVKGRERGNALREKNADTQQSTQKKEMEEDVKKVTELYRDGFIQEIEYKSRLASINSDITPGIFFSSLHHLFIVWCSS